MRHSPGAGPNSRVGYIAAENGRAAPHGSCALLVGDAPATRGTPLGWHRDSRPGACASYCLPRISAVGDVRAGSAQRAGIKWFDLPQLLTVSSSAALRARYCQKVWIDVGFATDFEGCQTPLCMDASRSSNWTSWSRPGMLLSSARTRPAAVAKPASERNREEGCVFGRSGRFGSLDGWRDLVPMRLSRPEAA